MNLKLNLEQETVNQILLQDVSQTSAGVSRVILDFVSPVTKRVELNGLTEIKAYNFVNPLVNALLLLKDTDFGQSGFTPDIYELDYSVHYPYREELFANLGNNLLYGINMLTLLGDAEWMYFGDVYYKVVRAYSTEDYLFLDKPVEKVATTGEFVYRNKIYIPLVEKLRQAVALRFRSLTGPQADIAKLQSLMEVSMILIGLVDNVRIGDIKSAKQQIQYLKTLVQWEKQLPNYVKP